MPPTRYLGTVRTHVAPGAAPVRYGVFHADHHGSGGRPDFLEAMKAARIKGALVGVESVTPEGLKDVYKDFNSAGESLVERLRTFRSHFAQFVTLTPFPGTVDLDHWERAYGEDVPQVAGVPITRRWLIPHFLRPKLYCPHSVMSAEEIRERTQAVWDRYYSLRFIWQRSHFLKASPDVCRYRHCQRQRPRRLVSTLGASAGEALPASVCWPPHADLASATTRVWRPAGICRLMQSQPGA